MSDIITEKSVINNNSDIALIEIYDILNKNKRSIFIITILFMIGGLLYAVLATPVYTASVIAQPVDERDGDLSGLAGQFGGVAALAGINLGGSGGSREEYLAVLRSRALAQQFISKYELKPYLFPDRWDEVRGGWKADDPGFLTRLRRQLSRFLASISGDSGRREPSDGAPSDWQAYEIFDQDIRVITEDVENGLVSISFRFRDPVLAAKWASGYVELANSVIRARTVDEAKRALDYLVDQAEKSSVAGIREAIFSVIESQLKRIALANARPEFAFRIIDPPVIPEQRSHPRRMLILILSFMLGAMAAVSAVLIREAWRRSLTRPAAT